MDEGSAGIVGDSDASPFRVVQIETLLGVGLETEQLLEGAAEFRTENGVEDGIQRRVEVAEPQKEGHHRVAEITRRTNGQQQRHDEERQPADDERSGDDGQRLGRFTFTFRLRLALLGGGTAPEADDRSAGRTLVSGHSVDRLQVRSCRHLHIARLVGTCATKSKH